MIPFANAKIVIIKPIIKRVTPVFFVVTWNEIKKEKVNRKIANPSVCLTRYR